MIVALCWSQGLNTWKNGEFTKKRTKLHSWSYHVLSYIPTSPQHGILGDASIQQAFPSIWIWPFSKGVAFSQNTKLRVLIYFFLFWFWFLLIGWLLVSGLRLFHLGKICAVRLAIICSIIFFTLLPPVIVALCWCQGLNTWKKRRVHQKAYQVTQLKLSCAFLYSYITSAWNPGWCINSTGISFHLNVTILWGCGIQSKHKTKDFDIYFFEFHFS